MRCALLVQAHTVTSDIGFVEPDAVLDETNAVTKTQAGQAIEIFKSVWVFFLQSGDTLFIRSDRCGDLIPKPRLFFSCKLKSGTLLGACTVKAIMLFQNACLVDVLELRRTGL